MAIIPLPGTAAVMLPLAPVVPSEEPETGSTTAALATGEEVYWKVVKVETPFRCADSRGATGDGGRESDRAGRFHRVAGNGEYNIVSVLHRAASAVR